MDIGLTMNNFYYFLAGCIVGGYAHKHMNKILYKMLIVYGIMKKYYEDAVIYFETNNTVVKANICTLDWVKILSNVNRIDTEIMNNVINKFNKMGIVDSSINLENYISCEITKQYYTPNYQPFYYNGKKYEYVDIVGLNYMNRIVQHITHNLYEPVLSASFICEMINGDKRVIDITDKLNTMLFCNGFFVFDEKLHTFWWLVWNEKKEYSDISGAKSFSIEFMDRESITLTIIQNCVVYVKDFIDRNFNDDYIDLNSLSVDGIEAIKNTGHNVSVLCLK